MNFLVNKMEFIDEKAGYGKKQNRRRHHKGKHNKIKDKRIKRKFKKQNIQKIALIGNPNVGKSVIFYYLADKYATVSNYPGTTVEIMRGYNYIETNLFEIIDTPGIYQLVPLSEDEKVTKEVIINEFPNLIVQVADAKNLRRTLLFTFQVLELGLPLILILNMMDEARRKKMKIDMIGLSQELGIPISGAVAVEKEGIGRIKKNISKVFKEKPKIKPYVKYPDIIEKAIEKVEDIFKKNLISSPISPRAITLSLLEDGIVVMEWLESHVFIDARDKINLIIKEVKDSYSKSIIGIISETKESYAERLVLKYLNIEKEKKEEKIKKDITIHKIWGPLITVGVLSLIFLFVGYFGAVIIVDFLSTYIFGPYSLWINSLITNIFQGIPYGENIINILAGDLGLLTAGLEWTMGLILPIVFIFFLSFAVLEDSGYLSRVAINSDRLANKMGLNGKAIIPIILGFGCGTSALMTTRILDTKKERIISSLLISLAIPCSAQLGILIGLLFQVGIQWGLIVLVIVIIQLFIIGYLAGKIVPGKKSKFIIEVPPMRLPKISNVFRKTWIRTKAFLKEAVPLFFIGILLISILTETDLIHYINDVMAPITESFLGLPRESSALWILGVIRRDLGAAALFETFTLTPIQSTVGTTLIILFLPCMAAILVLGKERGIKNTLLILGFVFVYSILISGFLNIILTLIFG